MTVLVGLDVLGQGVQDIAIRDGVIVVPDGTETRVDCQGLVALPALVDPHTHLRDPGPGTSETIESGSRAAARGGYGAVCAMPNTVPVADTPEICTYERRRGSEVGLVDVVPIGAVTVGEDGAEVADIAGMGAVGVRMFSDDGRCVARSDVMRDALREIAKLGGVLAQHAQDPLLTVGAQVDAGVADRVGLPGWPTMAESAIVARDAIMAAELRCRVHACHVSTAQTVAVVRWAKSQGYPVTAEVTPHHLMLDSSTALTGDARYKVNPPLRSAADVQAVREAFVDGTIDVVGTDHAPHAPETKAGDWCEASMGMLGLETALAVVADLFVRTGRLSWADVAERMSYAPARLAGLDAHGRPLEVGAPANLCLVDPRRTWRTYGRDLASIAENTPYEGVELSTRVVATLLRGKVTYDLDGRFA
ncbi:MAG TPA: dihydroorotase [Propionibacteriaceae bacterium]|nr:dihydroorotase [Propionibacteriaceae bacterium]